jgi:F-type H+-transporting ATPase subunit c
MLNKKSIVIIGASFMPSFAFAAGALDAASQTSAFWAAGICMGLAAAVVGFSQSRAAVSALDGIGRNPAAQGQLFVPLILSLALMESLALLAFVVANTLVGK